MASKKKNKYMDNLHSVLSKKSSSYATWHKQRYQPYTHWAIFAAVSGLMAIAIIARINDKSFLSQVKSMFSQASTSCPGFTIEGLGRDTVGGCGGTVLVVNTLSDVVDAWNTSDTPY